MVKKRERGQKPHGDAFEAFVDAGESAPATSPGGAARGGGRAGADDAPAWVQRAQTDKKTESQPLRYNRSQARLLTHAKEVEGRDYSKILADLIWPQLEEKYGKDVPLE